MMSDYLASGNQMPNATLSVRLALAGCAAIGSGQVYAAVAQEVVVADTEELFTIGFNEAQLFFGEVTDVVMAPDGSVAIHDRRSGDGLAVTVLSPEGEIIGRWGRSGDGPGELSGGWTLLSIEGDTVLVAGTPRSGFYNWSGQELSRRDAPLGLFHEVALLGGEVFAWRQAPDMDAIARGEIAQELRFGPWHEREIWQRRTLQGSVFSSSTARPLLAVIPGHRMVAGYGDEYVLHVIAAPAGDTIGTITREVAKRSRSETEAFLEEARHHFANPAEAPVDWSSVVRRSQSPRTGLSDRESLPMVRRVFWGPPGVLWVERGLGIADEYAGPIDHPDQSRLWDLFEVGDTQPVFRGAIALPDGFRPYDGSRDRLVGLVYDELDRQAIRVLRVEVPGERIP